MTPAQYAANFWSLRVFLTDKAVGDAPAAVPMALPDPKHPLAKPARPLEPGRWNNFKVDRYRLRPSGYAQYLAQALRNQFAIGVRVINLDGSIGTYSVSPVDIAYSVVAPFGGKGYPEECQMVLQLWDRYGIPNASLSTLISSAGIGLDCNGFVGGYIDRRRSPGSWMRGSDSGKTGYLIRDLVGGAGGYLGSWEDLRPPGAECLIMGMCDAAGVLSDHGPDGSTGHIVITEPGSLAKAATTGPVSVDVVESTGPIGAVGLQRSSYRILSMTLDGSKKGIFRVQRGSKLGTPLEHAHFRITRLA